MMQDGAIAVHSDRLTGGSRMDGWGHKATAISRSRLVPSRPWFPWQRGGSAHFSMHNLTTKVGAAWQRKMSGPACCCRCSAVLLLLLASLHCHALAGLIAHTTGKRSQVDVVSLAVTLIFHPSLAGSLDAAYFYHSCLFLLSSSVAIHHAEALAGTEKSSWMGFLYPSLGFKAAPGDA